MRDVGSAGDEGRGGERPAVVVPFAAGPLLVLGVEAAGAPDELDEVLDELLGDDDPGGPRWTDIALVAIGAGLIAWNLALGAPTILLVVGVVVAVLGLAVPARTVVQRLQSGRRDGRRSALLASGRALDATHPTTVALAAAYDRLLAIAAAASPARSSEAAEARTLAHLVLLETADALDGTPPASGVQVAYVHDRAAAVAGLADALARPPAALAPLPEAPGADPRDTLLAARAEVEHAAGAGPLADLRGLAARLQEPDR